MKRYEGKNVVITGCNRGIGKAMVEAFAKECANIIACTRKLTPEIEAWYEDLRQEHGVEIHAVQVEMGDKESIDAAIKAIFGLRIPVHVLINNAGVARFDGLMKMQYETLEEIFRVNYYGPMMLIKGLVMPMMKASGACVINMVSVAGMDGTAGNCAYGASKAALILATKTLSKELAKPKIRVNAIAPSLVETDMSATIDEVIRQEQLVNTAVGRAASAEEIANVALFLASEEASYINGQIIRVDGGM